MRVTTKDPESDFEALLVLFERLLVLALLCVDVSDMIVYGSHLQMVLSVQLD